MLSAANRDVDNEPPDIFASRLPLAYVVLRIKAATLFDMIDKLLSSKPLSKYGLIVYWIVMFSATHWPELDRYKPEGGWPIPFFGVVMHVTVYAGWTVMWWWLLRAHGYRLRGAAAAWVMAGGIAYGIFDELTQAIVERQPAVDDFTCDLIGILLAMIVLQAIDRWILKAE